MSQILSIWEAMDPRKRIVAVLSTIAIIAAVYGLVRAVNAPHYALLYAGLDASTSGEIVTALEGQSVSFEVRGDAIYVDSSQRDHVRMSLASDGLPANGVAGYELLDGLSGFSTTSQMFDAAYWRAKEGELARTILASPNMRAARVHIANPVNRPFDRTTRPSASVIATMVGGTLSASQARAIRFLVSSAVAGLDPESVSVIDSVNGVILAAGSEPEATPSEDITQRADGMRSNIERLLAARVGAGNAIVEVNIDADMDSETITERVLDPEGRVAISADSEEQTSSSQGSGGGGVTVASNLPDGDVEGGTGDQQSSNSRSRQRTNYEVSEILRERVKHPGQIRKVSVAVLVNGVAATDASGQTTLEPREEAELDQLRELVKSAIGFDEARGDIVTIESMSFVAPQEAGTLAEAGIMGFLSANAMKLIQLVVLAVVALLLGLMVLRPILASSKREETIALSGPEEIVQEIGPDGEVRDEIELNPEVLAQLPNNETVERLRSVITERVDETSEILSDWLKPGNEPLPADAAQPQEQV